VISKRAARWSKLPLLTAGVLALAGTTIAPSYAVSEAEIFIVQGLPGKDIDVAIDRVSKASDVKTGAVAGPFKVQPGKRMVTFSEDGKTFPSRSISVKAGGKADVVVGLPLSSSGAPRVTVYKYNDVAVPKSKALLSVANTSTASRIAIRLDNQTTFSKIANGRFDQKSVPVGTPKMSVVPTGQANPNGPVPVTINGAAMNRMYVVGDPKANTMMVAKHDVTATRTGSKKPEEINTGTGGQAVGKGPSMEVNLAR
jgi:hypothetical protein